MHCKKSIVKFRNLRDLPSQQLEIHPLLLSGPDPPCLMKLVPRAPRAVGPFRVQPHRLKEYPTDQHYFYQRVERLWHILWILVPLVE